MYLFEGSQIRECWNHIELCISLNLNIYTLIMVSICLELQDKYDTKYIDFFTYIRTRNGQIFENFICIDVFLFYCLLTAYGVYVPQLICYARA